MTENWLSQNSAPKLTHTHTNTPRVTIKHVCQNYSPPPLPPLLHLKGQTELVALA